MHNAQFVYFKIDIFKKINTKICTVKYRITDKLITSSLQYVDHSAVK